MSYYAKTVIIDKLDSASDYSTPGMPARAYSKEYTTVAEFDGPKLLACATGAGTTITLSTFTTILGLTVSNKDSTNYVTLTFNTTGTTGATMILLAGQSAHLVDITASGNLVVAAHTSPCDVEVFTYGT